MVRRADDNGIDVLLVNELPVVVVLVGLWEVAAAAFKIVLVGITDRDNVLRSNSTDIRRGSVLGADAAYVEFFAGSFAFAALEIAMHMLAKESAGSSLLQFCFLRFVLTA